MSNTGCVFQSVTGFPICALHGVELSRMPNGWRCHIGGTTFPWGTPFGTTATSEDGNQQPSGMRGDPGVDRATVAESRDPQSPHALPVSTVQALIDLWRAEAARIDSFHATMGTGYHVCADQLAALLASPSLQMQEKEEDKTTRVDGRQPSARDDGDLPQSGNEAIRA